MSDFDTALDLEKDDPRGVVYGALSYAFWGITPVYWHLLDAVPPFALTMHRILWCAVFLFGVTLWRGRLGQVWAVLRTPSLFWTLALTATLITINWTVFIYCVATNQLVESSFGYFLNPLLSMALGVVLFGETMSRMRLAGVALAGIAVVIEAVAVGHFPWIGLSLALSFGFYGFFRKKAIVDSMDGLLIETGLFMPVALALIFYWMRSEPGVFPSPHPLQDALLLGAGPVTAIPLALFAAGARRIRLSTMGFLQYLSPMITLALAILGYHEHFTRTDTISFVFVWLALVTVALENRFKPAREAREGG